MKDFGIEMSGDDGTVKEWPHEEINRARREQELYTTDWTQVVDCPLSDLKKAEWATYRQALRDITSHSNWPELEEEDWPTQPS